MTHPHQYSYPRYLEAKQTVDEQALNQQVWSRFIDIVSNCAPEVRLLEIGAGVGTTAARILNAVGASVDRVEYTLVDVNAENLRRARKRLYDWFLNRNFDVQNEKGGDLLGRGPIEASIHFSVNDLFDYAEESAPPHAPHDALISQAVLDLLPLSTTLEALRSHVQKGGVWYLPIHFDGVTAFEPPHALDADILRLYHESMTKNIDGEGSGRADRTGRRLLTGLREIGATLLEVGSSDWVVFGDENGYDGEEAYFLYHILHFIEEELTGHPDLDASAFKGWIQKRRQQIEGNELIYIAHQLDVLARQGDGAP